LGRKNVLEIFHRICYLYEWLRLQRLMRRKLMTWPGKRLRLLLLLLLLLLFFFFFFFIIIQYNV
jgi:hypothetical protein